ncbi:hypothetical protein ACIRQH_04280 [Streptomyces sp. NPDC102279]|uniref:hypothetical protein n=1 Tax=Streptomyces sp. NPDC102279 TaxID=3366153 RepID=UPI0037FE58FD
MKSFRAATIALAAASIAFGGVIGTAQASSATPARTAATASVATDGNTDGDSGWGGRVINDPTTTATTERLTAGNHTAA